MKMTVRCKVSCDYYKDIEGVLADTMKDSLDKKTFIEGYTYEVEDLRDIGLNLFALYENGHVSYIDNSMFDKWFEVIESNK